MRTDYTDAYRGIESNPNLVVLYNWYIRNCKSINLPYHNLSHTLGMMNHIAKIYKTSQYMYKDYGFQLSDEDYYLLLVSALFHDYNHSGGKFDDETNVQIAIAGLDDCLSELFNRDEMTRYVFDRCSEIIKATQYPYVIPDSELSLNQRIIRECDILVCFYDDYITHNIFGLWEEMHTGLDIKEFTSAQFSFIMKSLKDMKLVYSLNCIEENQNEFLERFDLFAKLIV